MGAGHMIRLPGFSLLGATLSSVILVLAMEINRVTLAVRVCRLSSMTLAWFARFHPKHPSFLFTRRKVARTCYLAPGEFFGEYHGRVRDVRLV